jgi:RHS repeat-associated protein
VYTYTGNQLQTVADGTSNAGGLAAGTTGYLYDSNGNMLSATNTVNTIGNKSFTYNLLNLPATSTFAIGSATFAYDAAGNKLRKASTVSGTTTYTTAGIQHSGITSEPIEYIMTEEGQAAPISATSYDYQYFLGDNLGNTRESFGTKTGIAVQYQRDDYYPFGMEANSYVSSPKNYYLYNKKEQQPEFNENDYGARFYDPVIARWTSVDPLAEKYRRWSPYNYVDDNSIRKIDADGMGPGDTNGDQTPPGQTLTVDIKALDATTNTTTAYSQTTLEPDNIFTDLANIKPGVQNFVTSITQTSETTTSATFTNPNTGKSTLIASTTTTSTTVTIDPESKTGVGNITQTSTTSVVSTPVISTTKTTATLDISATKVTPGDPQTKQLPANTKLPNELKSKVSEAGAAAKEANQKNKDAAAEGIKKTIEDSGQE